MSGGGGGMEIPSKRDSKEPNSTQSILNMLKSRVKPIGDHELYSQTQNEEGNNGRNFPFTLQKLNCEYELEVGTKGCTEQPEDNPVRIEVNGTGIGEKDYDCENHTKLSSSKKSVGKRGRDVIGNFTNLRSVSKESLREPFLGTGGESMGSKSSSTSCLSTRAVSLSPPRSIGRNKGSAVSSANSLLSDTSDLSFIGTVSSLGLHSASGSNVHQNQNLNTRHKSTESLQQNFSEIIGFILETAADVIILIDNWGQIVFANHTVKHLLGYKPKQIIGYNLNTFLSGENTKYFNSYIEHHLASGTKEHRRKIIDVNVKRKDGSTAYVHMTLSPFSLRGETFFSGILRDVTDAKLAEKYAAREELLLKNTELLYDILPPHIVKGVQDGKSVAERHDNICVMFADIVSFTKYCSENSPELVVDVLNGLYFLCDAVIEKYPHALKIKFIGDCVLVCTGLVKNPEQDENRADDAKTLKVPNLGISKEALATLTPEVPSTNDRIKERTTQWQTSCSSLTSHMVPLTPRRDEQAQPDSALPRRNPPGSPPVRKEVTRSSSFEMGFETKLEKSGSQMSANIYNGNQNCGVNIKIDPPPFDQAEEDRKAQHDQILAKRNLSEMLRLCWTLKKELSYFCCRNCVNVQLRFGVNIGSVITGVLGKRRPVYDTWGDTVNVASRMESKSEPGRILAPYTVGHLVADTYGLAGDKEITVKGKGIMRCVFIEKNKDDSLYSDTDDDNSQ
eukprot:Nk52_evm15s257 gene=Nk52_evmTU15s257